MKTNSTYYSIFIRVYSVISEIETEIELGENGDFFKFDENEKQKAIEYAQGLVVNPKKLVGDDNYILLVMEISFDENNKKISKEIFSVQGVRTFTSYAIEDGSGTIQNGKGGYSFDSYEEALQHAKDFKANPRIHNEKMEDSNVEYWKNRQYTIVERVSVSKPLAII